VAGPPFIAEWSEQFGDILLEQGHFAEAFREYRRCCLRRGSGAEMDLLRRTAQAARSAGFFVEEIAYRRRIVRASAIPSPDDLNALAMGLLKACGRQQPFQLLRQAAGMPDCRTEIQSNFLLSSLYVPGIGARRSFQLHREWGERDRSPSVPRFRPNGASAAKLRIGYVSADFHNHSVSFFIRPILESTAGRMTNFCYSNSPDYKGVFRNGEIPRNITQLPDEAVAERIRKDRIDILVDIAGHSRGNRLGVFQLGAAPVQCTFLGYPSTTGLPSMHFRITDSLADPPGKTERFHTERLVRIDPCFLNYQPPPEAPEVMRNRSGPIVFGCFGGIHKCNAPLIRLWAEILLATPPSVLLVKGAGLEHETLAVRFRKKFQHWGVDPSRILTRGLTRDRMAHLAMYREVDIALDTFPYAGTTTTCEALWMGVPMVTLAGKAHLSRTGVTILNAAGMANWIAGSPAEYVELAAGAARDRGIRKLGGSLRDRLRRSPLMDGTDYTRRLEAAYRQMLVSR